MRSALNQPALHHRRLDEGGEQRVRRERARLQLGMELHADEPGVARVTLLRALRPAIGASTRV